MSFRRVTFKKEDTIDLYAVEVQEDETPEDTIADLRMVFLGTYDDYEATAEELPEDVTIHEALYKGFAGDRHIYE